MRVIAGLYRGRRLKGPRGFDLRPTGDRLKEALFNILAPTIDNSIFIDAFAGTGAIGIEALSRGAREVIFIESAAQSVSLIQRNLDVCGIETGYRILNRDVFQALRILGRHGHRSDVVFFDPPYDWTAYGDLLETTISAAPLRPHGRIIVEHHRKTAMPEADGQYRLLRRVRQGDQCLSFYGVLETESAESAGCRQSRPLHT